MPDGRLGMLEAGFSFTPWTRLTPLDYGINVYAGNVWVRQREVPLTPEEDRPAHRIRGDGRWRGV